MLEESAARCSSAQAALDGRRSEGAQRVLEAATAGTPGLPDVSLREARLAELDASDGLEAGQAALKACLASRALAEADLGHAQWRVENAVAPILAAEVERVLAAVERAKDELDGARAILSFLRPSREPGSRLLWRIMAALPATPPGERAPDYDRHPALAPWREAREALMRDADAALPI